MFPTIYHALLMQSSAIGCLQGAWVASRREPGSEWKNCVSLILCVEHARACLPELLGTFMWMVSVSSSGERNSSSVFTFPVNIHFEGFSLFLFACKCKLHVLFKIIVISLPPLQKKKKIWCIIGRKNYRQLDQPLFSQFTQTFHL